MKDYLISICGKELPNSTFFLTISYVCILYENLKIFQLYCAIWWSESILSDAAESVSRISEGSLVKYIINFLFRNKTQFQ